MQDGQTAANVPDVVPVTASVASPNGDLPVLVYRNAFPAGDADEIERIITANGWKPVWRDPTGFFPFHHFHSTAHEMLVLVSGSVGGRFGADGALGEAKAGDAVVLPAGTDHVAEYASDDLLIVGAYPPDCEVDLCRGEPENDEQCRKNIALVPVPPTDPVSGLADGEMARLWSR